MKKQFLLFVFVFAALTATFAQWTSPGNGTTYTMSDLAAINETNVTFDSGDHSYLFRSDVTISPNDCLFITGEDNQVLLQGEILLTIRGSLLVLGEEEPILFGGYAGDIGNLRLENCTEPSMFVNVEIFNLGGIKVIESDVMFKECSFQFFENTYASSVVNYQGCDPVFRNCVFRDNMGAAISSGVNVMGSPQIMYCQFIHNGMSNENQPQINLGPGAEDTIRIVGCHIEGLDNLNRVGGISVANLMQIGNTKLLLQGNTITNNRYGYNQQGYGINAVILDNEITDNDNENNAMNGGSGISINGISTNCRAILRRNLISGNLWGITAINAYQIDLGTYSDYGNNMIHGNHNDSYGNDREYALYVNGSNDIMAVGNYWGGDTEEYAESVIYHRPDLGESYGLVTYTPILGNNTWSVEESTASKVRVYPNPSLGSVILTADGVEGFDFEVFNALGQKVLTGWTNGAECTLDLGSQPRGVYYVTFIKEGQKETQRLLLQ